jgi:hypothetical protein
MSILDITIVFSDKPIFARTGGERVTVHSKGVVRKGVKTYRHYYGWRMMTVVLTNNFTATNFIAGDSTTNADAVSLRLAMPYLFDYQDVTKCFPALTTEIECMAS